MGFGYGYPYNYNPGPDYFGLLIVVGLIALIGLVRFFSKDKNGKIPRETGSLRSWPPKFLWTYKLRIAAAVIAFFLAGTGVAIGVSLLLLFNVTPKKKYLKEKEMKAEALNSAAAALKALGPTHAARVPRIEQLFEERNSAVSSTYFGSWERWSDQIKTETYVYGTVTRHLAAMDNREREHLRIAMLLNSAANGTNEDYRFWITMLLWAEGKGEVGVFQYKGLGETYTGQPLRGLVDQKGGAVANVISAINSEVGKLRANGKASPELRATAEDLSEQLSHGGSGWLKATKLKGTVFEPQSSHVLKIGTLAEGQELTYSGDGSMITVAPPGSGKTQCNVFPNLLTWKGPAVVLDISGDIYENTSRWRAANVGPVYKFSPLEPDSSHCYNPLTFVRREADFIWEDSRLLAEMMIVPSNSSDPFWENEARNVLTAAIAYVCYSNPSDKRPMHEVLDIMFGGEPFKNMITGLKMAVDVRVMQQNANALEGMNEKTLSSVLQTARSSLSAWTGERIARATKRSDWNPADLRNGSNPTIYIYIRPNEVEAYLSLLRVFIGQHIRILTGGAVPARGSAPILFMLDELPRLRNMPPVDEALNIGRKYGLRLWMFAQSVGQLKEAYKNADGMISSCAVRIYMNPSGADGLAEKLSEEIGNVDSLADGSRKRLVEAADLAGPAFRDQIIVFGLNARPAKARKDFAWKDETLKSRMGAIESENMK